MLRQVDQARLLTSGAANGLADPPGGIGAEVAATAPVELFGGAHQAEVAFLDQVDERHTGVGVAARNRDNKAEVCFDQAAARSCVAGLAALRQDDLFFMGEQREATNIVQIALEGIFAAIS